MLFLDEHCGEVARVFLLLMAMLSASEPVTEIMGFQSHTTRVWDLTLSACFISVDTNFSQHRWICHKFIMVYKQRLLSTLTKVPQLSIFACTVHLAARQYKS